MTDEQTTTDAGTTDAGAGEVTLGGSLGLTGGSADAAPVVTRQADEPKNGWWWGTGRRKTAVARVRIKPGSGKIAIQVSAKKTKTIEEYFSEVRDRNDAVAPLEATGTKNKLDVVCRCDGGGYMGQAGAIMLGLARALKSYDPSLEQTLRDKGFLTRDARQVERKKPGQKGARARFQFSKR
ncbi:MAG: 30S ribosomal protein S9 [Planctomycetota bacterium]|jgi:small subunit ribosomal protein S9